LTRVVSPVLLFALDALGDHIEHVSSSPQQHRGFSIEARQGALAVPGLLKSENLNSSNHLGRLR